MLSGVRDPVTLTDTQALSRESRTYCMTQRQPVDQKLHVKFLIVALRHDGTQVALSVSPRSLESVTT